MVDTLQEVGRFSSYACLHGFELGTTGQTLGLVNADDQLDNSRQKGTIQRALLELSQSTGLVPTSMHICDGVQNIDHMPVGSGSFADVLKATYRGQQVALKRVRVFQSTSESQRSRS